MDFPRLIIDGSLLQIFTVLITVIVLTMIIEWRKRERGRQKKKKIFFISPVQTATPKNTEACKKYVATLEDSGYSVHWPIRDTDQNDPIGIKICDTNLQKIYEADEIHIYYIKESAGINFDLGAVYMLVRILGLKKKIVFVNKNEFADTCENGGKSFVRIFNFLDFLDKNV